MANAWKDGEAPTVDERKFTPWAAQGYESWNPHSPELEFCSAAAELSEYVGGLVVETGAGQGYITRRAAPKAEAYHVYESMPRLRKSIPDDGPWLVVDAESPSRDDIAVCSLLIVDSSMDKRLGEISGWVNHAPDDSLLLMHDAGNGHEKRGGNFTHLHYWSMVQELGIEGIRYGNPRGSFLGWKTPPTEQDMKFYRSLLPVQE